MIKAVTIELAKKQVNTKMNVFCFDWRKNVNHKKMRNSVARSQ